MSVGLTGTLSQRMAQLLDCLAAAPAVAAAQLLPNKEVRCAAKLLDTFQPDAQHM